MGSETASRALSFVVQHLERTRDRRPLVVGLQGPQGSGTSAQLYISPQTSEHYSSGKSYLADVLNNLLAAKGLRAAVLSLDDLYLPRNELLNLSAENPHNALLDGRGLPGTHDVSLGARLLASLRSSRDREVCLPIYDKSAHHGQGDRSIATASVKCPVDVIIFEGWMLGFLSFASAGELQRRYNMLDPSSYSHRHSCQSIWKVNEKLDAYEAHLWSQIDAMIALRPERPDFPWIWRLQQEHALKSKNNGQGMSDDQVKAFVDRYAPAYEMWDFQIPGHAARQHWQRDVLTIVLDVERHAVG